METNFCLKSFPLRDVAIPRNLPVGMEARQPGHVTFLFACRTADKGWCSSGAATSRTTWRPSPPPACRRWRTARTWSACAACCWSPSPPSSPWWWTPFPSCGPASLSLNSSGASQEDSSSPSANKNEVLHEKRKLKWSKHSAKKFSKFLMWYKI